MLPLFFWIALANLPAPAVDEDDMWKRLHEAVQDEMSHWRETV